MFTKKRLIGGANVRAYKTVLDWDVIWGTIIVIVIILLIASA